MTQILEIRDKIKKIYAQYEFIIIPVVKFILGLIVFFTINSKLGYMTKLNSKAIVMAVSLLCSFLPLSFMAVFAAIFTVGHFYSLALEIAAITLVLYMILFMLVFRMGAKESALVVITPMLCVMKIPYVAPIAAGLLCSPGAFVSVACGTIVYYFLQSMIAIGPTVRTIDDDILGRIRVIIDAILSNKTMLVVAVAFAVTTLIVYFIRRLSVDYAWTIAMAVGALANAIILLVGALKANIEMGLGSILLGTVVALLIAKVIEFFRFCVDYSRTEHVQFEDDEYYYYVKAVPKMTVATPDKTVKTINGGSGKRGVSTERTGARPDSDVTDRRRKSVTVGSIEDGYTDYPEDEYAQDGEYVEDGGYYTEDGEYVEGTYEGEYYEDGEYTEEGEYAEGDGYYEGEGSGETYEDGTYSDTENYEEPYEEDYYEETDGEGNKY